MRLKVIACAVGLAVGLAATASAAQDSGDDRGDAAIEASRLPVSLERIKRRLADLPERAGGANLLRLNTYIDVYARAPAIEFLQDFDVETGPLAYGAPTHDEMLEAATPREWRPRAIAIGTIFGAPWRR